MWMTASMIAFMPAIHSCSPQLLLKRSNEKKLLKASCQWTSTARQSPKDLTWITRSLLLCCRRVNKYLRRIYEPMCEKEWWVVTKFAKSRRRRNSSTVSGLIGIGAATQTPTSCLQTNGRAKRLSSLTSRARWWVWCSRPEMWPMRRRISSTVSDSLRVTSRILSASQLSR